MKVGVKPLLHGKGLGWAVLPVEAAAQGELQILALEPLLPEALRDKAERGCGIGNPGVEREVIGGDQADSGILQEFPVLCPDCGGSLPELIL